LVNVIILIDMFTMMPIIATATITNNLRFPGQYYDAETGLHYNWHRYYWPEVGRYVKPDILPVVKTIETNPYTYVFNNPLLYGDRTGLQYYDDYMKRLFLCAYQQRDEAFRIAGGSGLPGPHNGPQDAYRHCVWSCLMSEKCGEVYSWAVGAGHEIGNTLTGQPFNEGRMDNHNNSEGRKCKEMCGFLDCPSCCMAQYRKGNLQTKP